MRFGWADSMLGFQRALPVVASMKPDVIRLPIAADHPQLSMQLEHFTLTAQRNGVDRPMVCLYSDDPDAGQIASDAAGLAERYHRVIWQVLNEPNSPDYGALDPRRVAALCERVRAEVRRDSLVIGPAMNPNDFGGQSWQDYFRAVYSDTEVDPSLHLYPKQRVMSEVDQAVALARDYGAVHVTEMCVQHRLFGDKQPELSRRMLKQVEERRCADGIFYSLTHSLLNEWAAEAKPWFIDDNNNRTELCRAVARAR